MCASFYSGWFLRLLTICLKNLIYIKKNHFVIFFYFNKFLNDEILFICRISLSDFFFMDLTVGQIVWARRDKNDIYWPGKITIISSNTDNLWSSELPYNSQQQFNYLVQLFITNQSIWITDILPYRQYRDSMTNDSFIHYGLHPTIKQDFLNAINQADYDSNNEMYTNNNLTSMGMMTAQQQQQNLLPTAEDNTDNDFLLTSSPMLTSNTGN